MSLNNSKLILLIDNYLIEVVESLHAIYTNNLIEGSIPRIYDCCLQAEPDIFECIQKLGGICRKPDYPEIVDKCEPNACNPFTTVCVYLHFGVEIFQVRRKFCL